MKNIIINLFKKKIDLSVIILIIIIFLLIYFFFNIYMRNNKKQVIVFDLDETLGCFVQLGAFCDTIEKYNKKKLTYQEFYDIFDLYPEFLRPNILIILNYLKEKKIKKQINKVFLYTNNQGPREWAERIINFLEEKINYKLFNKIIAAYKINGKIVENTRTTHDKTISDFIQSTNISKNTEICFIDDLYHTKMDAENVYYIHVEPYHVWLPYNILAERYYHENIDNIDNKQEFINFIYKNMDRYDIEKTIKTKNDEKYDKIISKELLEDLQNFIKINKVNKTISKKFISSKKTTRKNK